MAKKELSQLDIDIANANKLKMSYGRYMGLVKHPVKMTPRKEDNKSDARYCQYCGKDITFGHGSAKFCCATCREKYRQEQHRSKLQQKTCPICGKEFMGITQQQVKLYQQLITKQKKQKIH